MANPNQPWDMGNPPQQGGYPPQQQGGYPPQQQGGYPPQQGGGYPQQAPGYPPMGQAPSGYEFDELGNSVIGSAATWTLVLGIINFVQAAGKMVGQDRSFVAAGMYIAIGVLLVVASNAFRQVVNTQGDDIGHLMKALRTFGTVLIIRIVSFALLVLFMLIALGLVLAAGAALGSFGH